MNIKRKQIELVFKNLDFLKRNGIWYSGKKKHGEYKSWHKNGQLAVHAFYKDGDLHGTYKEWHDNDQMATLKTFKNGYLHGKVKEWKTNGDLIKDETYDMGIFVKNEDSRNNKR